jgi:energy-converting hydrogenase B subunit D
VIVASLVPLQVLAFVLAPLLATAVALTRDPLRQIVVSGVYGLVLAILFVVLQAPDVSLSMLAVSGVAYPLVVLAAIARVRAGRSDEDESAEDGDG